MLRCVHSCVCRTLLSVVLFFVVSTAALAVAHTRTEWIAKFNELDLVYNGLGLFESDDSSTLAWAESYILRAYLNMYEATGDTNYLNSFVVHVDTMLGNMDDANHDGYYGWDTMRYSCNMVLNPDAEKIDLNQVLPTTLIMGEDFETPAAGDATLPDGWNRWQSSAATAYLDALNRFDGSYGLTVETDPTRGWQVLQKDVAYTPCLNYKIRFMGKTGNSNVSGKADVMITGGPILASIVFTNFDWEQKTMIFTAPAVTGQTLRIRLYQSKWDVTNGVVHFDNLDYSHVECNLLPDGWQRWQSTADTAYRDTENVYQGGASFALVANTNKGWQVLQRSIENHTLVNDNYNYEPGIKYWVFFVAKTDGGAAGGQFMVYDKTDNKTLYRQNFTNTTWRSFSGSFTAPAESNHVVQIRLTHKNWKAAGTAYFDDIRVKQYAEYAVHDGMVAIPMANFVKMVYRGQTPAYYMDAAGDYFAALHYQLMPKWEIYLREIDATKAVYIWPDDGSGNPNNSLPHNQYLALAEACAYLAQALDGQYAAYYHAKAEKITAAFKSKLTVVDGDAYRWNYCDPMLPTDYIHYTAEEDTSHGNIDIATSITAYRAGITFDLTDMQRFTRTLLDKMWNGDLITPTIGCRVTTNLHNANQYTTYAWIRLGQFDRTVYDVIRTMYDNIWDNPSLMTWRCMAVISHIIKGVLLFEEDFEMPAVGDVTLPDGWQRWQSSSATAYLDPFNSFDGNYGVTVETNPARGWQVLQKDIAYTPGSTYQIKFMGKTGNTNVGGRADIRIVGGPTLASIDFANSDWEQKTIVFTAPVVTGYTLKLRLFTSQYNVADGIVHFDNVEVREIN